MLDNPFNPGPAQSCLDSDHVSPTTTSRRGFLKVAAMAGAAMSIGTSLTRANAEIGFWAKDLSNDQLIDMYTRIVRIRWHERTMADKMLTDPSYRGYNHFYAGQEAVAVGVCAGTAQRWRGDEGRHDLFDASAGRPCAGEGCRS